MPACWHVSPLPIIIPAAILIGLRLQRGFQPPFFGKCPHMPFYGGFRQIKLPGHFLVRRSRQQHADEFLFPGFGPCRQHLRFLSLNDIFSFLELAPDVPARIVFNQGRVESSMSAPPSFAGCS